MDREGVAEDREMLGEVDDEVVARDLADRGILAVDFFHHFADGFIHLLAVVAGIVEDRLERGVVVDLVEKGVLLRGKGLDVIDVLLEAVLQGVADRHVVVDERDDGFRVLVHRFFLSFVV